MKQLPVLRHLMWLWLALLLPAAIAFMWSPRLGLTLLWGVTVCLLPIMLFAKIAEKRQKAIYTYVFMRKINRAQAVKLALTMALFALVFKQADKVIIPVFFITFVITQLLSVIVTARAVSSHR